MTNRTGWLSIVALIAAGVAAYALGAPPLTLLIIAILLLCPIAIYFAMREMQAGPDFQDPRRPRPPSVRRERKPEDHRGSSERVK